MKVQAIPLLVAFIAQAVFARESAGSQLSKYFMPRPGQMVTINSLSLKTLSEPSNVRALKGYIVVTPPKGTCLVITRPHEPQDLRVCRKRRVAFRASHLSQNGVLQWAVATDDASDFGKDLAWPTPYRLGSVVPVSMPWPGPSLPVLIERCSIKDQHHRRIALKVAGFQQPWAISLPRLDYLVKQPKASANLFFQAPVNKAGILKAETGALMKGDLKGQYIDRSGGVERPKVSQSEQRGYTDKQGKAKRSVFRKEKKDPDAERLKIDWKMAPRGTFTMSGSRFMTRDSGPTGMHGRCRYNYAYRDRGPMMECHRSDLYHWVFLPVPCLPKLKQHLKKVKAIPAGKSQKK